MHWRYPELSMIYLIKIPMTLQVYILINWSWLIPVSYTSFWQHLWIISNWASYIHHNSCITCKYSQIYLSGLLHDIPMINVYNEGNNYAPVHLNGSRGAMRKIILTLKKDVFNVNKHVKTSHFTAISVENYQYKTDDLSIT